MSNTEEVLPGGKRGPQPVDQCFPLFFPIDDPEIHPSVLRWSHGTGQTLDPYGQSVHHHIGFLFPVSAALSHIPKFTAHISAFV